MLWRYKMIIFTDQHVLKRSILAIVVYAALSVGIAYAGDQKQAEKDDAIPKSVLPATTVTNSTACRVNDPRISGSYSGECLEGVAHGKGVAKGRDEYVGEFRNGNKHGKGTYTFYAGTSWELHPIVGEYSNDELVVEEFSVNGADIWENPFGCSACTPKLIH